MVTNPKLKLITITYNGGSVTAARGLLEHLFGDLTTRLSWEVPHTGPAPIGGRRRRKYGTKQKSSARAGEMMRLVLDNSETYTVRVVGPHLNFIEFFLARTGPGKIVQAFSERGTEYGPQVQPILRN